MTMPGIRSAGGILLGGSLSDRLPREPGHCGFVT